LRKARLVSIVAALSSLCGVAAGGQQAVQQEGSRFDSAGSYGLTVSYSPDSSHILIGESEQRRVWTGGPEYTHRIGSTANFRFDYEASLLFYQESDPTVTAIETTFNGVTTVTRQTPVRVITVDRGAVGHTVSSKGVSTPIYAFYGRQTTYAAAAAPLGVRIGLLQRARVQPSFAIDTGFLVGTRDIPIDGSDRFNFLFSFGPGVEVFASGRESVRLEYLFRHISNANLGPQNPGVDEGTFRLTLSRHR